MLTLRKWMDTRPLMLFTLCFILGAVAGYQNAVSWRVWLALLTLPVLLLCLRRRKVYVFCGALFLGALLTTLALIRPMLSAQDDVLLTGVIADEPHITEKYTRVPLESVSIDEQAVLYGVMLYIYPDKEDEPPIDSLEYGMTICAQVNTRIPDGSSNPFGYDYSESLWRQGIALTASASTDDLSILHDAQPSLPSFLTRCRTATQVVIFELYDEQTAPLVCALVLGDRFLMPDEMYDQFRVSGLAHLLAISGLHISCLAAALDWLLRKLRCPKGIVFAFITLFLIFYAAFVGFPASICRAVIMYVISASARLFGRHADGFTSLAVAALILLLINPLYISDPSFILSFSSVAGLLGLTHLFVPRRIFRIESFLFYPVFWIVSALAASLSAQIASLPAVACLFSELPVYSLLSNLPALPLLTLSLPFVMLSMILGFVFPTAGQILTLGVSWLLGVLLRFVGMVSSLPFSTVSSPVWPAALILLYALTSLCCLSITSTRRSTKRLCLAILPVLVLCALLRPLTYSKEGLEVLFLSAGQADAAVIRAEDQYYMMDVGENDTAAAYLRASGIRPAAIFISHPHSDHAGGLEAIVKVCPPAVIYLPVQWAQTEPDEGIPELIDKAQDAGWIIRTLKAGDTLPLSDHAALTVFQPWENMTDEGNGISLAAHVTFGESSVLFTGDLPIDDEYAFFPDCDVLKVAHHGSKYSTSELFLRMTSPSAAVISVGHNNYGHPAKELLGRLEKFDIEVYRTDQNGAICVLLGADGSISVTPTHVSKSAQSEAEAAA